MTMVDKRSICSSSLCQRGEGGREGGRKGNEQSCTEPQVGFKNFLHWHASCEPVNKKQKTQKTHSKVMSTITFKAHRCCFSDAALCFALKLSEKKKSCTLTLTTIVCVIHSAKNRKKKRSFRIVRNKKEKQARVVKLLKRGKKKSSSSKRKSGE